MKKYPVLYSLIMLLSVNSCSNSFDYSNKDVDLLEVSSRMVTFSTESASHTVEIRSDEEWTVSKSEDSEWLTIEKKSEGLVLNVTSNSTIMERETVLMIEAGERNTDPPGGSI